jgi:hypothetical protein
LALRGLRGFRLTMMASRTIARDALTYAASIPVLCAPALWNGFPLMFDDVGGYLAPWASGSLELGRSTVYGGLLWITRSTWFVPVVALQALATVFVVDCAINALVPRAARWLLPAAIAAIAATSGAAFFVSKAMPDAWAAPAVLAFHLLAWHPESFAVGRRAALATIVALAGAVHMATFGVLAVLSVIAAMAWFAGRKRKLLPAGIGIAAAAAWSGVLLLLAGNLLVTGRLTLTSEGTIFLFARMVEEGSAAEILAEECPRPVWRLCAYRDALPAYAEAFVFDADSPLQQIGGARDAKVRAEIASIVARSLARHPLAHASRALVLTATQFTDVGTGGIMEPLMSPHTRWVLENQAPALVARFDAARQQTEDIDVSAWSDFVVVPVSLAASFAVPVVAALLWWRRRRREALLPALLCLVLVGNAAICGIVSSPNDRYQARLVWLAPLAIGLTLRMRPGAGPLAPVRSLC